MHVTALPLTPWCKQTQRGAWAWGLFIGEHRHPKQFSGSGVSVTPSAADFCFFFLACINDPRVCRMHPPISDSVAAWSPLLPPWDQALLQDEEMTDDDWHVMTSGALLGTSFLILFLYNYFSSPCPSLKKSGRRRRTDHVDSFMELEPWKPLAEEGRRK